MRIKYDILKWLVVGVAIAATFLFYGCYTQKKATEQISKAAYKYPAVVAEMTRKLYPCTVLLKTDTITTQKDSTVYVDVDCPDMPVNGTQTDYAGADTVTVVRYATKTQTKVVRVPVTLPVVTKTVVRYFEDSAKIFVAQNSLAKSQAAVSALEVKVKSRGKWFLWALALLAVSVVINVIQIKRR
jgi:hypothetical protein